MERRTYLVASTSTLAITTLSGCGDENTDGDSGADGVEESPESDPSEEETTEAEDAEEESEDSEDETEDVEEESEDETEERLDPPELGTIELEPERLGPDDRVPRSVEIIATVAGGSPLRDGENTLRAEVEMLGEDRDRSFSEKFTVTGSGDWTEFETEIVVPTSGLLEGAHDLQVELFDDTMNAETGVLRAPFDVAEYNISTLEDAEDILEEIESLQQEMVDIYTSHGPGPFAQVPIPASNFDASETRDPLRDARLKESEFDVVAPNAMDDSVEFVEAVNEALYTITFYHDDFRDFANRVTSDLGLLRQLEFEEYNSAREEYESELDDLKSHQSDLESAIDEIEVFEPEIDLEGRAETFDTALTTMEDLDGTLDNLQSATEHIAIGSLYDEDNESGRREARLDANSRIRDARSILDNSDFTTIEGVLESVELLADDLEDAADDL